CGSTTWRTNPAATAASKAFPPASSSAMADCDASQWVEETIPKGPRKVGRGVNGTGLISAAGGENGQSRVGEPRHTRHQALAAPPCGSPPPAPSAHPPAAPSPERGPGPLRAG